MRTGALLLVRVLAGVTLAVALAASVNSTVVYAAGCCTQCTCVNLCINNDGCGSPSYVGCLPDGTTRVCNGVSFYDYCDDHCRDT